MTGSFRIALTRTLFLHLPLRIRFLESSRPIDVFVTYDGKRASNITVSRYAVRHLVSGEVCI